MSINAVRGTAARFEGLELTEQGSAVYQKGLTGLVTAEVVKQFDRPASAYPENLLDRGTVQDRSRARRDDGSDSGKSQKPGRLGGQSREASSLHVTAQICT